MTALRTPLVLLLGLLALALGLGTGVETLLGWTATGEVPGARDLTGPWPLALVGVGGLLAVAGLAALVRARGDERLERLLLLACAAQVWALGLGRVAGLPPAAAASKLGLGAELAPAFLVLTLLVGAFVLGLGPRLGLELRERGLVAWVLLGAANGRLLTAEPTLGHAGLALLGVLAVALLVGRQSGELLLARLGRRLPGALLLLVLALVGWWMLASAAAFNADLAWRLTWRLAGAALVTLGGLAAIPEERARALALRLYGALVLGLGVVLALSVLGLLEPVRVFSLGDVLASRARPLGMNPNLMAAYLALGLPLALGWLFGGKAPVPLGRRLVGSLLVAGLATLLVQTGSRSGLLGGLVGTGLFLSCFALPLGRRLLGRVGTRGLAVGFLLAGLGVAALVSPLGAGVRADLDQRATTQSALGQRWHFWRMASAAAVEHPWTGLGPGNFVGHARYAEPSYYDGTVQTWHTHNQFLAALEGAGFPGLVLFVLWLVAFLGLLLRVAAGGGGVLGQGPALGLLAAALGLLAANQLDLGQAQLTFVPLFYWTALLLAGLGLPGTPPELADERRMEAEPAVTGSPAVALLLLVSAWSVAGSVLVGEGLAERARRLAAAGQLDQALATGELARSPVLAVDRSKLLGNLGRWHERQGRPARRIELLEEAVLLNPLAAPAWQRLARDLLQAGQFRRAREAADEAFRADPRGVNATAARGAQAWAALELGQLEEAGELLLDALGGGSKIPAGMPLRQVQAPDGVGYDFLFLGPDGAQVSLLELLRGRGEQLVAASAVDQLAARRGISGLASGFQLLQRPLEGAAYVERMAQAMAAPIRSVYYAWIELLVEGGALEQARAALAGSPFADEAAIGGLLSADSGAAGGAGFGADLFYAAGAVGDLYLDRALLQAEAGDRAAAVRTLVQAQFLCSDLQERARLAHEFLLRAPGDEPAKLDDLGRYLAAASLERANLKQQRRLDQAAGLLLGLTGGDRGRAAALLADLDGDLGAARAALAARLGG